MKCPGKFEVPAWPTWMNTIHNRARNYGHIDDFSHMANALGYPFILWNDRVYFIHTGPGGHEWASDTGWDVEDVGVNTMQAPELDRFINFGKDSW